MSLTRSHARMTLGAPPCVLDRGADNTGTGDTRTRLLAAAAASPKGFHLPSGTYRLASDTAFTAPVSFDPGAVVRPDAGVTVTFNGGVQADLYQVFDTAASGALIRGLTVARPEWFGAVRNGGTDDSAAINRALACVGLAGGGEVLLSGGNYAIASSLALPYGVKLRGCGRTATCFKVNSLSLTAIDVAASAQHWEVSGLSVINAVRGTSGAAVYAAAASVGRIIDVRSYKMSKGVVLGDSVGTKIEHCEFSDFTGEGILISGSCNDVFLRDTICNGANFDTGVPNPASTGLRVVGKAEALMVQGLDVVLCNEGLFLTGDGPTTGNTPAYSRFSQCFFDSCLAASVIDNSRNLSLSDCWFSNRPGGGLSITGSRDVIFTNCSFINNHQYGCLVGAGSTQVRFMACSFDSNGQASAGAGWDGVAIAAGVTDFSVIGCFAGNGGRFAATQGTGISVEVGASDRYVIHGNLVTGNLTSGTFDGGTGVNKLIAGNY